MDSPNLSAPRVPLTRDKLARLFDIPEVIRAFEAASVDATQAIPVFLNAVAVAITMLEEAPAQAGPAATWGYVGDPDAGIHALRAEVAVLARRVADLEAQPKGA